jgi:hypothetical protein
LAVKVAGEPTGLNLAEPVRCEGLTVQFWEVERKAGIAFREPLLVVLVDEMAFLTAYTPDHKQRETINQPPPWPTWSTVRTGMAVTVL